MVKVRVGPLKRESHRLGVRKGGRGGDRNEGSWWVGAKAKERQKEREGEGWM